MRDISSLAEDLLASQEGLCSMMLTSNFLTIQQTISFPLELSQPFIQCEQENIPPEMETA
jgi:hypothetical protein